MLDPYNKAYYADSLTKPPLNNKVSPLKSRKTLPKSSRSRKKTSKQHADTIQRATSLKTPPPSPSPPLDSSSRTKRYNKRIPKVTVKKHPNSTDHHHVARSHLHHHHHHHHYYRRYYKDRRSSSSLSSRQAPSLSHQCNYTDSPRFDKDVLDTFCFHWPAMHCYVLVRILPHSVAILPIRTRLAFLYFCHAPRPHHPTASQQQEQQQQQRRIQSMFKSWKHTLAFNDSSCSSDDDDDQPSMTLIKAVTLTDVLKDHRMGDVGWIHAPCQLVTADDNFVTLRSKCTTLELKARCYSEKKMFIHLFHWNQQVVKKKKRQKTNLQQKTINADKILMVLERQNQQLQQNVDDLVDQMNRRQTEILQLEEQSEALEAQMDTLWTALDRQKEQQAEYNDMKETMVSARQELRSHMDDFQHTHHRIMQRYLGQGSFAWVIEHSFQRLHRFQDRHTLDRQGRGVVYLTTGLLVLILALLVGYFIL